MKKQLSNYLLPIPNIVYLIFLVYITLTPLLDITNLLRLDIFLYFSLFALSTDYMIRNNVIYFITNVIFQILLYYLFFYHSFYFWSLQWIETAGTEFFSNLKLVTQLQWMMTGPFFRTFLFINLLWLALLIANWFLKKSRGIWHVIVTLSYLAFIDSVYAFNSKWLVILTLLISLIYIAYEKQRALYLQVTEKRIFSPQWIISAIIFAILITSVGFAAPKSDPSWVDPTGFLSKFTGKGIKGFTTKKIGYSDDDTYLGGPFQQDDTLVMNTKSTKRIYWRGESKDQYTGHGWINSEKIIDLNENSKIELRTDISDQIPGLIDPNLEQEYIEQTVTYKDKTFPALFFGGDLVNIFYTVPEYRPLQFTTNKLSQNVIVDNPLKENLKTYFLIGRQYIVDEKYLKSISLDSLSKGTLQYELYTQLPQNIPKRVKDLSIKITANSDNPYDKAKDIETYLRNNYIYETDDVPVPGKNEDFVDQFLFESKRGYCDHYSSSMVVMARSIGIPARWVKGFTPGETEYIKNEGFEGEVRNKNAHSWAEIYLPNVGWIPFEPTASFYMPLEYKKIESETTSANLNQNQQNMKNKELLGLDDENISPSKNNGISNTSTDYMKYGWLALITIIVLLLISYPFRASIWFWWMRKKWTKEKDMSHIIVSFTNLLLTRSPIIKNKKHPSETVREYFKEKDMNKPDEHWVEATKLYESARYSDQQIPASWRNHVWKIWKHIIYLMRS